MLAAAGLDPAAARRLAEPTIAYIDIGQPAPPRREGAGEALSFHIGTAHEGIDPRPRYAEAFRAIRAAWDRRRADQTMEAGVAALRLRDGFQAAALNHPTLQAGVAWMPPAPPRIVSPLDGAQADFMGRAAHEILTDPGMLAQWAKAEGLARRQRPADEAAAKAIARAALDEIGAAGAGPRPGRWRLAWRSWRRACAERRRR